VTRISKDGNQQDINDGAPWSELDIQDLKIAVKLGYLPEWLASGAAAS
jgi:hypothetical protein